MNLGKYSHLKFHAVLGVGAVVAFVLCVQCVRTYWYTGSVLVPQQAEREAERQAGALSATARTSAITDPRSLGPLIKRTLESSTEHVLWVRVLDLNSKIVAQVGEPQGSAVVPARWWERIEKHESVGRLVETPRGPALAAMLPFRMPRAASAGSRPIPYVIELAIPLAAVSGAFDGLRENLIVGLIAAIALLASLSLIALRTPHYLRGKYLESELQLAKRVQSDLQPKPHSVSPELEFAASAVAADHVGGDFYDVFEAEAGKIAIVLGDASGKGVPAALLVSVLQGAIRSSTASHHEQACERINRMLCERTACERFATLFWGVYDPRSSTLRYVNAGHVAPILIRHKENRLEQLADGGPVLGLLPRARYSAGAVHIDACDSLVLFSDGISEATGQNQEEFGEQRIQEIAARAAGVAAPEICGEIMDRLTAFSSAAEPADDRTLMVVRFLAPGFANRASSEVIQEDVA